VAWIISSRFGNDAARQTDLLGCQAGTDLRHVPDFVRESGSMWLAVPEDPRMKGSAFFAASGLENGEPETELGRSVPIIGRIGWHEMNPHD